MKLFATITSLKTHVVKKHWHSFESIIRQFSRNEDSQEEQASSKKLEQDEPAKGKAADGSSSSEPDSSDAHENLCAQLKAL
eukprot:SAG11_NODE_13912_length_633_cov_1.865169_1_plen_80_part_10